MAIRPLDEGGAVDNYQANPTIANCIFWANERNGSTTSNGADIQNTLSFSVSVENCLTQDYGTDGQDGNIVGQDPKFRDESNPMGADGMCMTADDGLNLVCPSPAINKGNDGANNVGSMDITGANRLNGTVDMGSYESNSAIPTDISSMTIPTDEAMHRSELIITEGVWSHYCTCDNELLLSLNIGGSDAVIPYNGVTVNVKNNLATYYTQGTGFIDDANGKALMNRTWNVEPTKDPISNVGVRFYYTNADYAAVNTKLTENGYEELTAKTEMEFYKTIIPNGNSEVASLGVNDVIILTNGSSSTSSWEAGTQGNDNYAEFEVSSFSGGGGGGTSATALPVELSEFSVSQVSEDVLLTWETLTEINNSGFSVQRSSDGIDFYDIGWVDGNGSTSESRQYRLIDADPFSGYNYYD